MALTDKIVLLAQLKTNIAQTKSWVTNFVNNLLKGYAKLDSPEFSGVPTAPKAEKGSNTTQIATTSFVKEAVDAAVLEGVGSIDLTSFFDDVTYDSESKNIQFKNGGTVKKNLSAAPFIKDGMVNEVKIADGTGDNLNKKVLLITFNTDAGKDNIEIPLDGIFNANNYYTSTQIDSFLQAKADASKVSELETEVDKKLDANTYNTDKVNFATKDDIKDFITEEDLPVAKIENGTITLGTNSIKPLVESDLQFATDGDITAAWAD